MDQHMEWKTVTYPGVLACSIPISATQRLIDDGTTICITDAGTDVLASLYPLRQATLTALEMKLRDFTDRCVRSVVNVSTESYELANDVEIRGIICCQSVLTINPDMVWIARAYARNGGNEMLLVHWNGRREQTSLFPLPLFVSLIPLFALERINE